MIDGNDRLDYTTGGCYDLALAIHGLTGWQLAIESWEADRSPMQEPSHAVVLLPDGIHKLDVYGVSPLVEGDLAPTNHRMVYAVQPVDAATVESFRWMYPNTGRTQRIAEYLVDQVQMGVLDFTPDAEHTGGWGW